MASSQAGLVVSAALAGTAAFLTLRWIWRNAGPKKLIITVPATTANLACGFDTFGAALDIYLTLEATITPREKSTRFVYQGQGAAEVVLDETNLTWVSAVKCQQKYAKDKLLPKMKISVQNPVPFGRGLGSSACAIISGVVLANEVLGLKLTKEQLLNAALEIEDHPDNLSAALFGGATASGVDDSGNCFVRPFKISPSIRAVVVIPKFQLSTQKARDALPEKYPKKDCIFNLQRVALLPLALSEDPPDSRVLRELLRDKLHQGQRSHLIPGLAQCLAYGGDAALQSEDCIAIALSGAGPSIIALCTGSYSEICHAIEANLKANNVETEEAHENLPFSSKGTQARWSNAFL